MKGFHRTLLVNLLLVILATACAPSGYWVPPSAPPSSLPPLAALPEAAAALATQASAPQNTPTAAQQLIETASPIQEPAPTIPVITSTSPPETEITGGQPADPGPSFVPVLNPPKIPTPSSPPVSLALSNTPILYYAQAADTLPTVAVRFGVSPDEITSSDPIPPSDFLNPGQLLIIPRRLANTTSSQHLIPDSEVVFSPSAADFDISDYVLQAGGKLSTYRGWLKTSGTLTGAEVVMRVATENSINPRLLLSLLEYQSGWVYGQPSSPTALDYPLGYVNLREKGLYRQLVWAVNQLSIGYYAYREGRMTEINFSDGVTARLAPDLNAGSAALQYYFAQLNSSQEWLDTINLETGLPALHARMFDNPWLRAQAVEPLYPPGITQPPLILPFTTDWGWAFTGGPHGAWEHDGAYAALDFAPGAVESGCVETQSWVTASASGLVVRSNNGVVVIDLDGDGSEATGWVLTYLHLATKDRIPVGAQVDVGDPIGHASCEGGMSTGTHIHIARKYNGEWVPADGPLPFNLSGWIAHAGAAAYKGTMTRGDQTITASTVSNAPSFIRRQPDDP